MKTLVLLVEFSLLAFAGVGVWVATNGFDLAHRLTLPGVFHP